MLFFCCNSFHVVTDVCQVGTGIFYWMQYENDKYKFVNSEEVEANWPMLAIEYLEENLSFN